MWISISEAIVMPLALEPWLKDEAKALGFDACGITRLHADDELGRRFESFIAKHRHGDMDWLASTADRRKAPHSLWPEARSAVVVGLNYGPGSDPLGRLSAKGSGNISVYAWGDDYHELIKGRLKTLAGKLAARSSSEVKVFVDTAPLMEKPLARKAGVGWQGKHTNLVSRVHGSWLFLGAILTTAELAADPPEEDRCGSCRACLDICPTKAFPAPYQLDARRCISYLTIEHKGHIDREFRDKIGNRIYGCDDCLAVCPWNKFATAARELRLASRADLQDPPLAELLALDDAAFRRKFARSPVKRTGRNRFLRNVLIAAGNSGNAALIPHILPCLADESPLVRAMAVWALSRLGESDQFAAWRQRFHASETDAAVSREWLAAQP
jgi:epoxyqueuosine reductase